MKTFRSGAALVVTVIACAACAGSVVLRIDGWVGWVLASFIFGAELIL